MSDTQFIHVGTHLVALAHIVAVEFTPADPGGIKQYDSDIEEWRTTTATTAKLTVTTTAIESKQGDWDNKAGYGEYAMPRSVTYSTRGREAEDLWDMLADRFVTYPDPRPEEVRA